MALRISGLVIPDATITIPDSRPIQTREETVQRVALRLRDDKLVFRLIFCYSRSVALANPFIDVFRSLLHEINPSLLLVGDLNVDLLIDGRASRRFRRALQDLNMRHCTVKLLAQNAKRAWTTSESHSTPLQVLMR